MRAASIRTGLTGVFLFASGARCGQSSAREEFEVASVKPYLSTAETIVVRTVGGPGTSDPGRIVYEHLTLMHMLRIAYGMKDYQISGPSWLNQGRYYIEATIRPGATKAQVDQMLRNLLADRFKLALHRETKEVPLYELVVVKKGPKLRDFVESPSPGPRRDKDGFLWAQGAAGTWGLMDRGVINVVGGNQTISDLADSLSAWLSGRPILDKTGLTGRYDFSLKFTSSFAPADSFGNQTNAAPDLFTAVQDQLGLKLNPKKGPIEMLVIDHVERTPTEN